MAEQYVLHFENADHTDVGLLGGKGAGLAEMTARGLPVPPGFIITTEACRRYLADGRSPAELAEQVAEHLRQLQDKTGKTFGGGPVPLLLSVRSGAPISMPGMMDTILDLGLSRDAAIALGKRTHDVRFVVDVVRRFQAMYGQTVLGMLDEPDGVQDVIAALADDVSVADAYDAVWSAGEQAVLDDCGGELPTNPDAQLHGAIEAVFRSWNTRRARTYRSHHRIPETLGTAVVVQSMVFGNLGDASGSGVAFSRNPINGEPELYGEFLFGGQGEDVVSGAFTPETITRAAARLPGPFEDLERYARDLETARGDVLDIEFTIEDAKLFLLQVRAAKRTAQAAIRIADDLWNAGRARPKQALAGVTADHVRQILRPSFDEDAVEQARSTGKLITIGTGACPGQVTGELCFDCDTAQSRAAEGTDVILARPVTSPADLHGMIAARGIVTGVGGSTSHAAVVARALGTACVVGCGDAQIDPESGTFTVAGITLHAGDDVSLDGSSGELFAGVIRAGSSAERTEGFGRLLDRCREVAGVQVWGRVTLPSQIDAVRESRGSGVVLAIDDILAASGHLDEVTELLQAPGELSAAQLTEIRQTVTGQLTPLLKAADGLPIGVRSIDLVADDSREYLRQTPLMTAHPDLLLPLGVPQLLEMQVAGVVDAIGAVGRTDPTQLTVRHVSGPGEAAALEAITAELRREHPDADLQVGIYATSPAALTQATALREHVPVQWIELKTIQAVHHGLPPRVLLTREPLDSYLDRGLLPLDPRSDLDPAVADLLAETTDSGVRLALAATEQMAADLYGIGYRIFAAEGDEVAPLLLCLGKAALAAE